ncbi:unnamed protein product [Victoria cruziana]
MALFSSQRRRAPSTPSWRITLPSPIVWLSFLIIFVLFSLLYVSLIDLDVFVRPPHPVSKARRKLERESNISSKLDPEEAIFRVPNDGRSDTSDRLWRSKRASLFYGCSNSSNKFATAEVNTQPNRYLMIATSGGLNQQRTGITDAVVAARILNATLVVPKLDQKSFWKDASNFSDIFDADWFISSLTKDVTIIKQLPKKIRKSRGNPYTMRVPRKCTPRCYHSRVLPVLLKKHVVELTKFDFRLANKLDTDLQKLRCRANYHALRFTKSITWMGQKLVRRMREKSGHFVALHLRFEPDMLAFSGCDYGGGEKERRELGAIRRRWKTLHKSNPEKERRHGKCPLTPEEVGLMLRALGFGRDVFLYVASGEVYGGEETLAPLKKLFPNFYSKETLTTKDELTPFSLFSSRMAALDYIVCDESDVFVTNNNGNMAKMLAGRRRYLGHKRTIRPNGKKLYSLFLDRANMSWEAFASKVRTSQKGFMGEPKEMRPGRGEFHENPSTCICELTEAEARNKKNLANKLPRKIGKEESSKEAEPVEDDSNELEPDLSELDYVDDGLLSQRQLNETDADYGPFFQSEETELEDMLSD